MALFRMTSPNPLVIHDITSYLGGGEDELKKQISHGQIKKLEVIFHFTFGQKLLVSNMNYNTVDNFVEWISRNFELDDAPERISLYIYI